MRIKKTHIISGVIIILLAGAGALVTPLSVSKPKPYFISPTPIASVSATLTPITKQLASPSASLASCHSINGFPDSNCTPGVTNPAVTQANINATICVPGYTKTIRPPVSYTNALKTQQIKAYGYTDTNVRDYEEDHLISLEIGGSPADPKNLWPEPGTSPNVKDGIENMCHQKICSGKLTLADAQKQIATNWQTACQ